MSVPSKAATIGMNPRFRRLAERLHANGPRAYGEALAEIAAIYGDDSVVLDVMERHSAVCPTVAKMVGADVYPIGPIEEVPGE